MFRSMVLLFLIAAIGGLSGDTAHADGPKWSMKVITFGKTRKAIKSKPIHLRPNRPLHFYGNSQRRAYYRNKSGTPSANLTPRPKPEDKNAKSVSRPPSTSKKSTTR